MLDTIKAFFASSPAIAWTVVSVMIAMAVMVALWEQIKWWWLNTWMSVPFFGRIDRLSRDINPDPADNAWFKAEKTLCRDYKKFIRIQDEHDFNEKNEYINKAGDNGRSPMPIWIWILTFLLVFVEAMGFSYVLAGWTIPGASENLQQYGAMGIAFLVSVLLVGFTHLTGHELYVSTKIKHARREWVEDGRKSKFSTGTIALAGRHSQSSDDALPPYTQLANRVGTHESYKITGATILFILIVAAGATYVRGQVLEKTLHEDVVGNSSQLNMPSASSSDGLNMSAKGAANLILPNADVAQNQAAKDKAVADETNIDRHGGWGTFIVLAFIFVFLQLLGVIFGYRWGFAGQNSFAAYRAIGSGRYTTYADVRVHYKDIADTAQAKLERLQQKLMKRNAESGNEGKHTRGTFYEFMKISRDEELHDFDDQREHTTHIAAAPTIASNQSSALDIPPSINDAVRKLASLQSKDARQEYVRSLPERMQSEVLDAFLAIQEVEKSKAARAQHEAKMDRL